MAQNFNTGINGKSHNVNRSGHDLSQKKAFTAKIGELLPVYWHFATPGSKWRIVPQHFSRTQPLNTSAFIRLREHVDFYEVPLVLLWKSARSALLSMGEVNPIQSDTPLKAKTLGSFLPTISLDYIGRIIATTASPSYEDYSETATEYFYNEWNYGRGQCTYKLLSYLGYGALMNESQRAHAYNRCDSAEFFSGGRIPLVVENYNLSLFPLLAYQKVYADFFRNTQWEKPAIGTYNIDFYDGKASFVDEIFSQTGVSSYESFFEAIYGVRIDTDMSPSESTPVKTTESSPTMFDLRYALWDNDLFHSVMPNTQFGDVSDIDIAGNGALPLSVKVSGNPDVDATAVFKLSSDHAFSDTASKSERFGFDGSDPLVNGTLYAQRFYSHRLFLGVNRGEGNMVFEPTSSYIPLALDADAVSSLLSASGTASAEQLKASFNVIQLRAATALQKLREIQEFNHYDSRSQVNAVYGYNLPRESANLAIYRGGYTVNLDINEVVNNNITGDNQATIAGKGTSSGRASIEFTASDFSVIIGLYYAVPMLDYDTAHVEPQLMYAKVEDWPNPVLDSIGLEPVLIGEISNGTYMINHNASYFKQILGYTSRYYSAKTKVDVVTGAFTTSLRDWVAPMRVEDYFDYSFTKLYGSNLIVEQPHELEMSPLGFFHVCPNILDRVFGVRANDSWDSDQLLVNMYIDCQAVLPYSRSGMPY